MSQTQFRYFNDIIKKPLTNKLENLYEVESFRNKNIIFSGIVTDHMLFTYQKLIDLYQ